MRVSVSGGAVKVTNLSRFTNFSQFEGYCMLIPNSGFS